MTIDAARRLFESGRSHALSSDLLYRSAAEYAQERELPEPELFAFNGTFSLSTHLLLGLGLELMLKAAMIAWGGPSDEKSLREIGHDLVKAFDAAESSGFKSNAVHLREIVQVLHEPYKAHWFRYSRPDQFLLPGDFSQVAATLETLDEELQARLWTEE